MWSILFKANGELEKTTGPPSQRLAQQGSGGCQCPTAIYTVDIWDHQWVIEPRNDPFGLCDDDDIFLKVIFKIKRGHKLKFDLKQELEEPQQKWMHVFLTVRHFGSFIICPSLYWRSLQWRTEFGNKFHSSFNCWFTLENDQKVFNVIDKFTEKSFILHLSWI